MLLKNKIRNEVEIPLYDYELKGIEKVADNYAIEFAEWCIDSESKEYNKYKYRNRKELLEIYKKEKQL